jgi:L-fuconate dehydratase
MTPEELVALVDFRYLTDALTPDQALVILRAAEAGKAERIAELEATGYPAYTTSAGWLGYDDDKVARLVGEAIADGFTMLKLKVGADVASDIRRLHVARLAAGEGARLALDANQRWGVRQAIEWMAQLAAFNPYWIEEPTSPDDVLGHRTIRRAVHPIRVATGEHVQNRVVFKQLLQAEAIDIVQIDACRVGGVNENLAILLLAAKFGVPVCPHAGGVGLCEMVQHLAMFDFVAVSGTTEGRWIEYVDHLHEHFVAPVVVTGGRYRAPTRPGGGAQLLDRSIAEFRFPDGPEWASGT